MASDGEPAPEKHRGLTEAWKPGQSGNPSGRPKGSRNKLGDAFIADLHAAWQTQGAKVIERVIEERPQDFLKVVASLLPKQIEVREGAFDSLGDEELAALVVAARSALAVVGGGGTGSGDQEEPQPAVGVSAVH